MTEAQRKTIEMLETRAFLQKYHRIMDALKQLKSFIGKAFTDRPSPFMQLLSPIIVPVEQGHLEFKYTVRKEWLNPVDRFHGGFMAAIIDDVLGATMFSLDETSFYTTIYSI